jgi:hypothetical protein
VAAISPATWSLVLGVVVPMPTFPPVGLIESHLPVVSFVFATLSIIPTDHPFE